MMHICDQLIDLDPMPTYETDAEELQRVIVHVETVGCAFGGGRNDAMPFLSDLRENNWSISDDDDDTPIVLHQNEITGDWCVKCGYHHPHGQHEIPLDEAVAECKRISEALPRG
jgi:hypothetical protein